MLFSDDGAADCGESSSCRSFCGSRKPFNKNSAVGAYTREIAGVQNILVPGYTHMGIMESPAVQERILSEVE